MSRASNVIVAVAAVVVAALSVTISAGRVSVRYALPGGSAQWTNDAAVSFTVVGALGLLASVVCAVLAIFGRGTTRSVWIAVAGAVVAVAALAFALSTPTPSF